MNLSYLYNLDESRTSDSTITEIIKVPEYGQEFSDPYIRVNLGHLPKEDTLVITRDNNTISILTDGTMPTDSSSVAIDYRSDYDYVAAKGTLLFSKSAEGLTYTVSYIPVASRVDALNINELITIARVLTGKEPATVLPENCGLNVWSKDDLLDGSAPDSIDWSCIKNRPTVVTSDTVSGSGLMSVADKAKLDAMANPSTIKPIGSILLGIDSVSPAKWGGGIKFIEGDGIKIKKENSTSISFTVDQENVLAPFLQYSEALKGTTGIPSVNNKFVTDDDPRLTNNRYPTAHAHTISDIATLQVTLNNKAAKSHTHTLNDILKDINNSVNVDDLKGAKGDKGDAATVSIGTVTTVSPSTKAAVTNVGTTQNAVLNFSIPQGVKGDAASISIGTVTTGAAGSSASVTNSGDSSGAVFNFTIPKGDKGATGPSGTVKVGTVSTGAAGSSASVTNSGTSNAAILNFTIPKGDKGDKGNTGATGSAATITVGTVTTGAAGSAASVTNSGTSSAAILNFTIPKGADSALNLEIIKIPSTGWVLRNGNYCYDISTTKMPVSLPLRKFTDTDSTVYYELVNARVRAYSKGTSSYIRIISNAAFEGIIRVV